MIKVGILGAESLSGGELIRILAMHPEVEILAAQGTGLEGIPISRHHHGLIGETDLTFTGTIDYSRINVLFVCNPMSFGSAEYAQMRIVRPDLKVILLKAPKGIDLEGHGVVYGLPEYNRKLLVRGATGAIVPSPFASMALVALFPFASHLLLNGDIRIKVSAPATILEETDLSSVEEEILSRLKEMQRSFSGAVDIIAEESGARRSALMEIRFACGLTLSQMEDLYEIYDDHNFAFATTSEVGVSEVAGTDKCVVQVGQGEEGEALLNVVADCRLRGGAGEAVHIMNLMFGLHEKTGLALKAIDFTKVEGGC